MSEAPYWADIDQDERGVIAEAEYAMQLYEPEYAMWLQAPYEHETRRRVCALYTELDVIVRGCRMQPHRRARSVLAERAAAMFRACGTFEAYFREWRGFPSRQPRERAARRRARFAEAMATLLAAIEKTY